MRKLVCRREIKSLVSSTVGFRCLSPFTDSIKQAVALGDWSGGERFEIEIRELSLYLRVLQNVLEKCCQKTLLFWRKTILKSMLSSVIMHIFCELVGDPLYLVFPA